MQLTIAERAQSSQVAVVFPLPAQTFHGMCKFVQIAVSRPPPGSLLCILHVSHAFPQVGAKHWISNGCSRKACSHLRSLAGCSWALHSSVLPPSRFSAWACNVGACSVGMRTNVCGKGTLSSGWGSASLLGFGSLAVMRYGQFGSYLGSKLEGCLHEAMLMARRTLCQLLITNAMADEAGSAFKPRDATGRGAAIYLRCRRTMSTTSAPGPPSGRRRLRSARGAP